MKLRSLLCVLLMCTACSRVGISNEEPEEKIEAKNVIVSCTSQRNEHYTFFAAGDEITSMQEELYMSYEDADIYEEMDTEEIKNIVNQRLSDKYSSISGVSAIVDEVADGQIKIIFMIDFEVADFSQLVDAGLINEGDVQSQYVSLKKTREQYTKNGFACEIQ